MIKTPATNEDPSFIAHSMIKDIMDYLSARTERITLDQITDDDTDYLPAASSLLDALIRATCLQAIGDDPEALIMLLEGLHPDYLAETDHGQDFYTISSEIGWSHPTILDLATAWDCC